MAHEARELADTLARDAEAVCRHYLSNGRREDRYWLAGDARNTPGRSLYVRLSGPAGVGKWTDAATGDHGDLLDIIRHTHDLDRFTDVAHEARRFLRQQTTTTPPSAAVDIDRSSKARALFDMARPIAGTVAQTYLAARQIPLPPNAAALRFHPRCYYRATATAPTETWPAMIAALTDLQGRLTGAHRTWLAPTGLTKAPIDNAKRGMGQLIGSAVRFGQAIDVMAVGEGIETILSLGPALPMLPKAAATSAAHLAGFRPPRRLKRLYIAVDNDDAGRATAQRLSERAAAGGLEAICLTPKLGDFNDDLRAFGPIALRQALVDQMPAEDLNRFIVANGC